MKIRKYILEFTVFICGAAVMIFELVGSRILAPYLGTSIFVWTSLIGIILGSLSLGYWLGGKLADKKTKLSYLSLIIFISAIFLGLTTIINNPLLLLTQIYIDNIKINSIITSIILFSPTSILLGMVSPYTVRLRLSKLQTSGSIVGNLYAISTIGSIFGTFMAGFYLIPHFGITKILIILSIVLIITSLVLNYKKILKFKLFILLILIVSWPATNFLNNFYKANNFLDINTAYNRVWIYNYYDDKTNQSVREMMISNEKSSVAFLESAELASNYAKYFNLIGHFNPDFKNVLMIGGAAYAYPRYYLEKYPNSNIDIVEIDPMLTVLAQKYFNLKLNSRMNIYHEDGRIFLNKTDKKYDAILGDAFKSQYSLPYQLTTIEAVEKKYNILNDNGLVILNVISSIEGSGGKFLRAEYATYKNIFPQVYLFPVNDPYNGQAVQNIILIALKSNKTPNFKNNDAELNSYLDHLWKKEINLDMPILTDDFAPVDYYINQTI